MNNRIIVVGASAGGTEALIELLKSLSTEINSTIFISMHLKTGSKSLLFPLLQKNSNLPVIEPKHNETYKLNHVYICPPDRHLLITAKTIELTTGPKINYFRPSIEILFNSAAIHCGSNTIGILLSGLMDDGVEGLYIIKRHGGVTMVQDPKEAKFPDLPLNAIATGKVDYTLSIAEIALKLNAIVHNQPPLPLTKESSPLRTEMDKIFLEGGRGHRTDADTISKIGDPSILTCPDCHGTLWEIKDDGKVIYRCRTGHFYGLEGLKLVQDEEIEKTLWSAVRALEESSSLSLTISKQMNKNSLHQGAVLYESKAQEAKKNADALRSIIQNIIQIVRQ
jgi:two-component system chemotaxis response regulator CheB